MAEVTYQAPEKPQGTVTIVLTEEEARKLAGGLISRGGYLPSDIFDVLSDIRQKTRRFIDV